MKLLSHQALVSSQECSTRERSSPLGKCERLARGQRSFTNPFFSQGAWFIGNCIANIIGGVVAYGIGNTASDLQSWRLLFLVLGGITSGYAIVLFFVLPDSPAKASFLTETERVIAVQRTLKNKTGTAEATEVFQWNQVWEAVQDPQAWFLVLYTFCVNLCNGGLTSVSGLRRFGPVNELLT